MGADPGTKLGGEGSGSVLVVEDDRATRELLGTVLTIEGIGHQLTSNGHEAMRAIRDGAPALVILDLHLPSVGGEAVGTALRIEFGPKLPILAMSASREQAAADRIGAYAFLPKPFELERFVALVRAGLGISDRTELLRRRSQAAGRRVQAAAARQRASFESALERRRTMGDSPKQNAASS